MYHVTKAVQAKEDTHTVECAMYSNSGTYALQVHIGKQPKILVVPNVKV